MQKYNKIVSVFKTTITKLEKLSAECDQKRKDSEAQRVALEVQEDAYEREANAAANTAAKLKELIGV